MTETSRVVVGVNGSLNSLAALHRAVAEARRCDALLVVVLAWTPPGGDVSYRRNPCPPLLREWRRAAAKRLDTAFEQAFGGHPQGVRTRRVLLRDQAGPGLVSTADGPGDLLVVGAGVRGRWRRLFHGSVARYCLAHATCPVVAVPPSHLLATLRRAVRAGVPAVPPADAPRAFPGC